ncbi:MAG: serine/threonine protein kinase [Deltaproteobacteria bacterium]|nr:serine/threonine protein kinase [Deltaproteobacteria bacterium]
MPPSTPGTTFDTINLRPPSEPRPARPPPRVDATPPRAPADPGADPRLGAILGGRYRILARIGHGGMGVVYRGERLGLGRPVAIKFLRGAAAQVSALRHRFAIEARAASRLRHPGCVAIIDVGLDGDAPYAVMDYVAGRTLARVLEAGPIAIPRALRLSRQILAGLAHAHAHGIVHRDIKPENVLVWADELGEHAQITDFGVAKLVDGPGISQDVAIGTPSYMSPEQTLGEPVDERADVYGAGVLLFELLTEHKPFRAARPFETMRLHREAPVPTFDELAPERSVPPEIEGVVRRALAKAREDRYASAIEFAAALERAAAAAQESSDGDLGALLVAAGARRRWRGAVIAIAFLAVLGLAAACAWLAITGR